MNGRAEITARYLELWDRRPLTSPEIHDTVRLEYRNAPWSLLDAAWSSAREHIAGRLAEKMQTLQGERDAGA